MHTDEAVNAYRTGELLAGQSFHYDPKDRHGPALCALAEPIARLCGARNFSELTETQLRLSAVLPGAITVLLFGAGVEMFGFIACLVAALLFAFAPLPLYYSRYFIHETLFVAATLGFILSGWWALKTDSKLSAALAGLCAALMLATKETAVIHFFAAGVAGLVSWLWSAATCPRSKSPKVIVAALGTFWVVTILLFTWFGQNWSGLMGLFRAIPHLVSRAGGEGHEKPFLYYADLLTEMSGLVVMAALGCWVAARKFVRRVDARLVWLLIYSIVTSLIYSAIPYKTPWLALNIFLPLALLAGVFAEDIWSRLKTRGRIIFPVCLALVFADQPPLVSRWIFQSPADENNPYAYAHTGEDLLNLPERMEKLARPDSTIAVIAADPWPLPWYLRKFSRPGYWQPGQGPATADFYITSPEVAGTMRAQLTGWRPEFFGGRPGTLIILWRPETKP